MIKKLLGFGIFLLGFVCFVNAGCFQSSNSEEGKYLRCDSMDLGAVYSENNYYLSTFSDSDFNFVNKTISFNIPGGNIFNYWWKNGQLFYSYKNLSGSVQSNGKINGFFVLYGGIGSNMSNLFLKDFNYATYVAGTENLLQYINSNYKYGFLYCGEYSNNCKVCLADQPYAASTTLSAVCIDMSYVTQLGSTFINDVSARFIATLNGSSSVDSDLGSGGIELGSNESALNYYESRYGRDKSICYVGTDSLSYLYGQNGVSFQEGQGLSIFDVYGDLYGSGYELKWVGNWLNTWLLNYEEWFNSRGTNAEGVGHPSWLSYYNSGTHLGDLYYDNLTFPFANQPVAFYFMATYIDQKAPYSTMGAPVVSYCNIKINSGTFEDIIDQSDKNNITDYTEQNNTHLGLNPDGTDRDYGYWLGSGVDVAFSGNVTIKNTLKNFFDQFFDTFKIDVNQTRSNPILPGRLATCLLFVVLFKFIRRR